jgi:hypothetical protein
MYATCTGLLTSSGGAYPGSSVFEINASGVSLNKIVIGKPASQGDAGSGYMSPSTLAGCLATAMTKGWSECRDSSIYLSLLISCATITGAGVMTWEFPDAEASWISTVRSKAFA